MATDQDAGDCCARKGRKPWSWSTSAHHRFCTRPHSPCPRPTSPVRPPQEASSGTAEKDRLERDVAIVVHELTSTYPAVWYNAFTPQLRLQYACATVRCSTGQHETLAIIEHPGALLYSRRAPNCNAKLKHPWYARIRTKSRYHNNNQAIKSMAGPGQAASNLLPLRK